MTPAELTHIVTAYLQLFPDEVERLQLLRGQLAAAHDMANHKTLPGHGTGSAIVLSPDKDKILLIHHGFLKLWLQPGGHWEPGETNPLAAAKREAEEETAVQIAQQLILPGQDLLVPIDIDSHNIPARQERNEPAHVHHDFRYVFVATNEMLNHQKDEVNDAQWFDLDAPETEHVRGVIAKLRSLKFMV